MENENAHKEEARTGESSKQTKDTKMHLKESVSKLEAILDEHMVRKAPFTLPTEIKDFLVQVAPFLVILSAILSVQVIFGITRMSTVSAPLAMMSGYGWGFGAIISLVVAILTLILTVKAIPGLFKRTHGAWRLMFYVSIIAVIGDLLSFNLINALIVAVISWYLLFQVKASYKN